jgi:hypothetical protein
VELLDRYPAKITMVQAAVGPKPVAYTVQYPDSTEEMDVIDSRIRVIQASGSDVGGVLFLDGGLHLVVRMCEACVGLAPLGKSVVVRYQWYDTRHRVILDKLTSKARSLNLNVNELR